MTLADCPPGNGEQACFCVPDSLPCEGLDEAACAALGPHKGHDTDFCASIRGGSYDPATGFADDGPPVYLGCQTNHGEGKGDTEEETCCHAAGSDTCHYATTTALPDDWSECSASTCECATSLTADQCPAGSHDAICCCKYPESMPCFGLDEDDCGAYELDGATPLCLRVMGRAWDAGLHEPSGPELYLGCRSQCPFEDAHGSATCTHGAASTSCAAADDARIPDGWSTDCSTCE